MALRTMPGWVGRCFLATLFVAPVGAGVGADPGSEAGAETPPAGSDYSEFTLAEITRAAGSGMDGAGKTPDGGFEQPETTTQSVDPDGTTVTTTTSATVKDGTLSTQVSIKAVTGEFFFPTGSLGDATAELEMCPNPRGLVRGSVRVVAQIGSGSRMTTGMEAHRTFNIRFSGKVNDAAHLTDYFRDSSGSVNERTFDEGKETVRGASWSQESAYDFGRKRNHGDDLTIERERGRALPSDMEGRTENTLETFDEILIDLLRRAEARWRSGYCVEVRALEGDSKNVKPNEKVKIVAQPYHKLDNTALSVRVEAKLAQGSRSVAPKHDDGPEAKFVYTAPKKTGESGTVELRSVSRRGIGTTTLTYDTGGDLRVDAFVGDYPIHFTGTKCDGPAGTWTVQFEYTSPGLGFIRGEVTFTLDPQTLSGPLTGYAEDFGELLDREDASYDPATSILQLSGAGGDAIPVQQGSFC